MQAEGLASATINRRLAALRRVTRLAAEWGWISHPPTVRLLGGEEPRTRTLTEAQVKALGMACSRPARDCILLGAYTGLRMGEILRLQADQVAGDTLILTRTKTSRQRAVPVPQIALPIIARIPLGISYAQLRREFEAARIKVGMPEVQFRDLRRTYGSWIVQRTGNLKAAQELLGHTTSTITSRHYAHLMTDHLRDAVASLNSRKRGEKTGKAGKPDDAPKAAKCA
jgi:integrase